MQVRFTLSWWGLSQSKPLFHHIMGEWAISALNAAILRLIKFQLTPFARLSFRHAPLLSQSTCSLPVDRRPDFDSFHILPTDHRQLYLRIYLRIGHGVLKNSSVSRSAATWLYLQSVYYGRARHPLQWSCSPLPTGISGTSEAGDWSQYDCVGPTLLSTAIVKSNTILWPRGARTQAASVATATSG